MPVFASEPGALPAITQQDVDYPVPFVPAGGYPMPAHVLSGTLPANVEIFVDDVEVTLPASIARASANNIRLRASAPGTGTVTLALTATNSVGADVVNATATVNVATPAPDWSVNAFDFELPVSLPRNLGTLLAVANATTIRVTTLPDKGQFFIDDPTPTLLAVNDTFAYADLPLLAGEAGGDTGAVTGPLTLRAEGPGGNDDIVVTVTIAQGAAPAITARTLQVVQETTANVGLNLTDYQVGSDTTVTNNTTLDFFFQDQS
jgi:hypothetical protein